MKYSGSVWKFGDNVDTDLIIPARFLNVSDKEELAAHVFSDHREDFAGGVRPGDVIVAGSNFGCGSSREHAPLALKTAGISVIIAVGFARIFYRNAFNVGLPILEAREAEKLFNDGDQVLVDIEKGVVSDSHGKTSCRTMAVPGFMRDIIRAGGLVDFVRGNRF